ncbi:Phospholipase D [Moelleriella libera RCEF 2490]|uniref:Phospholipase n=1 Tax=Moelleriella libera RCEF 2490 TaxID=1081109 RepID=A0A167YCI4_9HYPO|nr:Phospholipase D [Moelleriella libera RCEF 2490]
MSKTGEVPENEARLGKEKGSSGGFSGFMEDIKEKLSETKLHDAKVALIHKKHQIGKFGNLLNRDHRHDEEHEQRCDAKRSAICEQHRFESFFPERDGNHIKWYVDGRDYFWAVSVALEQAQESIYICDWWLSPELFLRRPPYHKQDYRLDQILKRRAEAGVKIYVSVYKEVEAALTCNSRHTKHALAGLCPEGSPGYGNIRVMRHPDHNVFENAADMTMYWAHHEKFIVIDYALAFIGGLDLCFGRWDARQHPLSDVHPEGVSEEIFPGQDFNNNRIMDFQKVQDWEQNELSKAEYGRMPWHDVAMGVIGPCVYDIAEHFVLRWNFVKRDKYKRDERYDWIVLEGREGEDEDLVGVQRPKHPVGEYIKHPLSPLSTKNLDNRGTIHAQVVRSSADWSSGILTDHSIQNAYIEVIRKAEHYVYIENQFFITATSDQQSPIHNTIGRAMVEAVVRAAKEGRKFRIIILIPAIPGFAGDLRENAASGTRAIMDYQYKSMIRGEYSIFGQIQKEGVDPTQHIFFFNLRSYDRLNKTHAICEAEKKTGISYQQVQRAEAEEIMSSGIHGFEDSSSDEEGGGRGGGRFRHHLGGDHLRRAKEQRLEDRKKNMSSAQKKAAEDAKIAREIFEKEKPQEEVISAATVAHHAMKVEGSLKDEPWDDGKDEESELKNWIQEELYVHSKILIADDRVVICGSSNINDRSQLGDHDSELSIVMEDSRRIQTTMDGKPFEAGFHAATLRRYLWREHLGMLPPQDLDAKDDINAQPPNVQPDNDNYEADGSFDFVADPLSDQVWDMWMGQARKNTKIFRNVFHADPDDHIKNFDDYDRYLPPKGVKAGHVYDQFMPPEEAREKLSQVRGHLVCMPMEFLQDAEMAERGLQVNAWTESVYT